MAAGYKDIAQISKDHHLDALRDREDFKAIIASYPGKAK
jgi:hypothetical protein